MTLIYGLCLPRKIYLISDSRLSSSDGTYKDDFGKWVDLNPRLAVIVANNAHMASWMIRRMTQHVRREVGWDWDFAQLEEYLKGNLKALADEYYSETGEYARSVNFIFGGFEKNSKLLVETSRLGEAMSTPARDAGDGNPVTQTVDMDILNAFRPLIERASERGETIGNGVTFEVDLPRPRVLAVSVRATNAGSEAIFEDTMCLDGIAFNPNYKTERITLPSDLLGRLNFRDMSGQSSEQILYDDNRLIVPYTYKLIKEKGWGTVGGELTPLVVLPDSIGIATGHYERYDSEGNKHIGGIGEVNGQVHYYDSELKLHPFRFIHDYLDEKKSFSDDAKL